MHARSHSMPGSLPQTIHRRTASNEALRPLAPPPPSSTSAAIGAATTANNRSLFLPGHQIVDVDDALGELPSNWSMARTDSGQKYFIK